MLYSTISSSKRFRLIVLDELSGGSKRVNGCQALFNVKFDSCHRIFLTFFAFDRSAAQSANFESEDFAVVLKLQLKC